MPQLKFGTQAEWSDWLSRHHASSPGIWVQIAKQGSGVTSLTYAEAVESALCYGWIDGQKQKMNETFWLQKFTPRKADSVWSLVNRQKALGLIERSLMQPAGHEAIQRAQANGRWESAYEGQSNATVPPDLAAALRESPKAAEFFAKLNRVNRYAILFRLQTAKKIETRIARLNKFVSMLERGETLH